MSLDDGQDKHDWVDRVAAIAAALGFDRVRVQWRLERWRRGVKERKTRAGQRVEQIRYEHKVCPNCGRVNDKKEKVCAGCEQPLGGHGWHVLQRIGLSLPDFLSVSSLLGVAMVLAYARLVLAEGGPDAIWAFGVDVLFRFGGHWPQAVWAGEWWRLGTSIFLHLGLWHIGFNLLALSQIGPPIEELFGRGRMLLFFLLTGVLANLGSELFGLQAVAIGASGAIMGLCGLAAGWGQRDGTSIGREARNRMLKWAGYTVVFGFFIGADNAAHVCGFVAGAGIGYLASPDALKRSPRLWLRVLQGLLGLVAATGLVILVLDPPDSPLQGSFDRRVQGADEIENPYGPLSDVCRVYRGSGPAKAIERWREWYPQYGEMHETETLKAEQLEGVCASLDRERERCRLFRLQGLNALYPEGMPWMDEGQKLDMERSTRSMCDWLEESDAE